MPTAQCTCRPQRLARLSSGEICTRCSEAALTFYTTWSTQFSLVQALQMPIDLLMLFQKQKSSNRMRSQPHKTRHPAPEHPTHAFLLDGLAQQPQQALRLLRAHNPRLDHVHGTADRRRHEAREQGGREVRRQIILERRVREQDPLESVVARELARRHEHGAYAVGPDAPP